MLLPLLVTACGVGEYLVTSNTTACLRRKGLTVAESSLFIPKDGKSGPSTRKVTKLDVDPGPKVDIGFRNHLAILVTPGTWDSDIGRAAMRSVRTLNPPWWAPSGEYVVGYRELVVFWSLSPTPEQAKLVEECFP